MSRSEVFEYRTVLVPECDAGVVRRVRSYARRYPGLMTVSIGRCAGGKYKGLVRVQSTRLTPMGNQIQMLERIALGLDNKEFIDGEV